MSTSEAPTPANVAKPQFLTTTRHYYTLNDGEQIEICVQSQDARSLSVPLSLLPDPSSDPWLVDVIGTVYTAAPGEKDTQRPAAAGRFGGLLVRRELIPTGEDEFLGRMMTANAFTQAQMRQLFHAEGRLRDKFRGRGIWGTAGDDAWVFEVGMIAIPPVYRREGVGKKLLECVREEVLKWARDKQRAVLMLLFLGAPKAEVDGYKAAHPKASGSELQGVSTRTRLTAKHFWRSLGFRRLSPRSNWFGWARPVAGSEDHSTTRMVDEWDSDDEQQSLGLHDDDLAEDVAEKWDEWKHNLDNIDIGSASGLVEHLPDLELVHRFGDGHGPPSNSTEEDVAGYDMEKN